MIELVENSIYKTRIISIDKISFLFKATVLGGDMKKNFLLFKTYLLAGTFTFSGGLAMLPIIEKDLCDKYNLISKDDFYEYAALSQTFPGIIALNNAFLVGKKISGMAGMISAGLAAVLPAYILMAIATLLYNLIPQSGPVVAAMTGVRAASASFLFAAAYTTARYNLKSKINIFIAILCFIFTLFSLLDVPILIILSAVIGVLYMKFKKTSGGDSK